MSTPAWRIPRPAEDFSLTPEEQWFGVSSPSILRALTSQPGPMAQDVTHVAEAPTYTGKTWAGIPYSMSRGGTQNYLRQIDSATAAANGNPMLIPLAHLAGEDAGAREALAQAQQRGMANLGMLGMLQRSAFQPSVSDVHLTPPGSVVRNDTVWSPTGGDTLSTADRDWGHRFLNSFPGEPPPGYGLSVPARPAPLQEDSVLRAYHSQIPYENIRQMEWERPEEYQQRTRYIGQAMGAPKRKKKAKK